MTKTDRKYSRKSIVDGQIYPINQLLRFTKNKLGQIQFDPELKLPGRGAYVLNNEEQIEILFKKKLLNRAFRQNIDIEIYESLKEEVKLWIKRI
ncbi:YlxR family protein [[Mycoplasma] falconis]|uniref:YlxR family protein n=1 Tax=[Mycoplasma] falconis TaxID=92403 RepID=A0A501XBE3_9BACT|nr:YlxR family protein [[Mycoplasma] falconis]TPE57749.1 YlxR family protein [[Mycoplasma] falconis]